MFLAAETGGFIITEANRIDSAVARIMGDQSGYYVLGFTPPPEALTPGRDGRPEYRRVKVEVLRPGLRVRSHQGFFGVPDEERPPASIRPELQLAASLESPFRSSDLRMEVQAARRCSRARVSLALSGIVFQGSMGRDDHVVPASGPGSYLPGEQVKFAFQVINAGTAPLSLRTRLFLDGAPIFETPVKPIETKGEKPASRFFTNSAIELPANLEPGEYLMRVDLENAWQWARLTVRPREAQ
jgi:hypothetical protein